MARLRIRIGRAGYLPAGTSVAPSRTRVLVVVSPQRTTVRVSAA